MLKGYDINKCSLSELRKVFNEPHDCYNGVACKVWFERPFNNINELIQEGYISSKTFSEDQTSEKILIGLEKFADKSKAQKDMAPLNAYRIALIKAQKEQKHKVKNWSAIWSYYNMLKNEVKMSLQEVTVDGQ